MASRLGLAVAAALALAGCDMLGGTTTQREERGETASRDRAGDGGDDRDTGRDRDERSGDRDRDRDRGERDRRDRDSDREDRHSGDRDLDGPARDDRRASLASSSDDGDVDSGVTREWFVGSWTDTSDCDQAGEFSDDGRYELADGTRGMWNVREGRLIVQRPGGRNEVRLRRVDDDTVNVLNADGSIGRSIRC